MKITESFRASMSWLHTWVGIGLSSVLFAIFWMGTLSVFDKEIDQWMIPETRSAVFDAELDPILLEDLNGIEVHAGSIVVVHPPSSRSPTAQIHYDHENGQHVELFYRLETGERIEPTESHAGTGFIFPFHFTLHVPGGFGLWITGLASIAMLTLIASGIFIHRKIITDFFTFRPRKKLRRSTLDLHNLTSMIALPFHILFPLTALFIFITTYFPWSMTVPYNGDSDALYADLYGSGIVRQATGNPGGRIESLDQLMEYANKVWHQDHGYKGVETQFISVTNHGDANAYVDISNWFPERGVALEGRHISFDAVTGEVLRRHEPDPLQQVSTWLEGAHWIQFEHWPLRWLFFLAGLSGCVMIASGLQFWMKARSRKLDETSLTMRTVRAMSVGAVTGIIIATGAFLVINRLLPKDAVWMGVGRADLEVRVFFIVWIASFLHAAWRDQKAWRDQAALICLLAVSAVMLNAFTTGDHIFASIDKGLWSIAGMDLVLLAGAAIAGWSFFRLRKTDSLILAVQASRKAASAMGSTVSLDIKDRTKTPAQ